MRIPSKIAIVVGGIAVATLLAGCPGMPGGPGQQQQTPSGVLPPPGMESGGLRTLMGGSVTAPDNNFLLVEFSYPNMPAELQGWQSARRFSALDSCILVEGLNYDGRTSAPKDQNILILYNGLTKFDWKYEPKPAPPAGSEGRSQTKRGK